MAIMVYDPTRGGLVSPEQARVVGYVVDTATNKRYPSVAAAQAATATFGTDELPTPTPAPAPKPAPFVDPQDVRDPKTGLTPAQVAAQKAQQEAVAGANLLGITTATNVSTPGNVGMVKYATSTRFEGTGANRVKITKFNDGTESRESAIESVSGNKTKKETRREMIGSGLNRVLRVYYDDGTSEDFPAGETSQSSQSVSASGTDPATLALIKQLQDQIANFTALQNQAKIDAAAAAEAAKKERAQNAISVLTDRFSRYGLASLVPKIRELAISGASEDTIALQLQETEEYKQRFSANQERLKKDLRVLDPGSYIGLEDRYRQILRAYGLKQFDTDSYVTQFLANDTSPEELSSRVVTAVQRVQNADPALVRTLKDFYGIGTTDMVAYVLDPTNQFPKIERQVAAAEIGTAARRQGLEAGVLVSEQLAAQGVTEAEARRGYATIADILPQAGKLSAIYTDVLDQYGQAEAEQEVFNSLASAQRKRRALTEREIASFAGQSGLGRTALGSITGGTY